MHRLFRILWVISRYRLDEFLPVLQLPLPLRILLRLAPWHWFPAPTLPRGDRLRMALEELGPVFVKFGQILSTRRDLLPDDLAMALARLQDQVPPFDSQIAVGIIEAELKQPVDQLFAEFDRTPLASASVAQVHSALLKNGHAVVVKVIRPDIDKVIRQDIRLMYTCAALLQRFWQDGHRLRPVEVVADYEHTIFDELDLQREAANASLMRRNFKPTGLKDHPLIYTPEVYWDFVSQRVLVMERIHGVPIADIDTLKAHQVDFKRLAEKGVEIFFTQVFRDSFFHADMHPGNIFVDTTDPRDPRYIAVDFGIMGTLSPEDQSYLARNLLAFFDRDYRQVAQLHVQSGWVPASTRVHEFEAAIRTVCEPIFEKPLKDISFGQFLLRLFQTARRFDMQIQPQLVLLQKTLLNVEGLGRQLYPDLDLWQTARPFLTHWMQQRLAPPGVLKVMRERLPEWLEQAPEMPQLIHDALLQIRTASAVQPALTRTSPDAHSTTEAHPARLKQQRRHWLAALCLLGAGALALPDLQGWLAQLSPWVWLGIGGALWLSWPRAS